jgi:preprotein translocase subunit SecG
MKLTFYKGIACFSTVIYVAVAVVIIILCLLQGGKSEGASGAITGGGLNVFVKTKERGAEKVVSILTLICAVLFFFIALLIRITVGTGA